MRLYLKYIRMVVRSTLQYRATVWLISLGQLFVSFFAYLGIALLFHRFGTVEGWTLPEVALCFGITHVAYAVTECLCRGFDMFPQMVVKGDFDRVLLRPRATALQVLGAGFEITRVGNLAQGALVLAYAVSTADIAWTADKIVTAFLMIAGGVGVFAGIFILGATASFFTVQGLEVINIFTNGGQELASYPLTIYSRWIIRFFTFVIPFGCINYLPLLYLTGRDNSRPCLSIFTPVIGLAFLAPCLFVWRLGVKYYTSTGS